MLVVSTFSPDAATVPCAPAGHSYLYRIDLAGGFTRGAFGAETGVTIGRRFEPGTTGGFAPLYQPADTGSVLVHSISASDLETMLANPRYRIAGRRRAGAAGNDGHLHACRVARRRFGGAGRDELRRPDAAALLAADEMNGPSAGGRGLLAAGTAGGDGHPRRAGVDRAAHLRRVHRPQSTPRGKGGTARGRALDGALENRARTLRRPGERRPAAGRVPVAPDSARGRCVLHGLGGRHGRHLQDHGDGHPDRWRAMCARACRSTRRACAASPGPGARRKSAGTGDRKAVAIVASSPRDFLACSPDRRSHPPCIGHGAHAGVEEHLEPRAAAVRARGRFNAPDRPARRRRHARDARSDDGARRDAGGRRRRAACRRVRGALSCARGTPVPRQRRNRLPLADGRAGVRGRPLRAGRRCPHARAADRRPRRCAERSRRAASATWIAPVSRRC